MKTLLANAVKLANSPGAPKCQGWDPEDAAGCWTHDMKKSDPVDYTNGFRMFASYDDAEAYAESLPGTYLMGLDTEVDRWAVTPMGSDSYGS